MTPDERSILQQFLTDLTATRGVTKDPEADAMIFRAIGADPNAAYLLVQHAILSDQALHAAQTQLEQLQMQAPSQPGSPSLLGGDPRGQIQQAPSSSNPFSPGGGLGGFLRSAGTMAAGVAGGEFLAQGLSNLFSPNDW